MEKDKCLKVEEMEKDEYLKVKDLCEILNISKGQAYYLMKSDGFPTLRLTTGGLRVSKKKLENWIKEHTNGCE